MKMMQGRPRTILLLTTNRVPQRPTMKTNDSSFHEKFVHDLIDEFSSPTKESQPSESRDDSSLVVRTRSLSRKMKPSSQKNRHPSLFRCCRGGRRNNNDRSLTYRRRDRPC